MKSRWSEQFKSFGWFLSQPSNSLRLIGYSAGLLFTLQWLFHFDQIVAAFNSLGISGMGQFLIDGFFNFLRYALDDFVPTGLLLISVLLGTTFAMLTYINQKTKHMTKKSSNTVVIALAGAGCAACGGSILAPLLSVLPVSVANQTNNVLARLLIATGVVLAAISFSQVLTMLVATSRKERSS